MMVHLENLVELEPGDMIPDNLNSTEQQLEEQGHTVERRNIYTDSVGYIESFEVDGYQLIVIDAMNGEPMVRAVDSDRIKRVV